MIDNSLAKSLYDALEKIRGKIDSSRFKEIIFSIFFLLFASKKFEIEYQKQQEIVKKTNFSANDKYLEMAFSPRAFTSKNILFVSERSSWKAIIEADKTNRLVSAISEALDVLKEENKDLETQYLVKDFSANDISPDSLRLIVRLFNEKLWEKKYDASETENIDDYFGKIYEYLIYHYGDKASADAGEFYTPSEVIDLLVNFLDLKLGKKIYDPCCGSGGMFLRSLNYLNNTYKEIFLEKEKSSISLIAHDPAEFYGQEINFNTISICWMGLVINKIRPNLRHGDTFKEYHHKHQIGKIDYVLANPPFNLTVNLKDHPSWKSDERWIFSTPSAKNANLAWIQHIYYYLRDDGGKAAIILANDSASSEDVTDVNIRKKLVESGCVRALLFLPEKLFYNTSISVCVWFLERNKHVKNNKILIFSYPFGGDVSSKNSHKLNPLEIEKLTKIYRDYQNNTLENEGSSNVYKHFNCKWKVFTTEEILKDNNDCVLTPGIFNLEEEMQIPEELEVEQLPFEPGKEDEVVLKEALEINDYLKQLSDSKNRYEDLETLFWGKLFAGEVFLNEDNDEKSLDDKKKLREILLWAKKRTYTEYSKEQEAEREKNFQEFSQLIKDPIEISEYNKFFETDENKEFLDFLRENDYCFDYNFENLEQNEE